jgi:hypothetical protein
MTKRDTAEFPDGSLISYPREDGAVQHVDWNHYLGSNPHPRWANQWMFLQDTLVQFVGKLSKAQLINNRYNFGNTRLMIGMLYSGAVGGSLSTLGWTWLPYDESNGDPNRTAITDAVSFTDDYLVPRGNFQGQLSVGTWARDIAGLIPGWAAMGYWLNQNPPARPFPINPGLSFNRPDNELPSQPEVPDNELPAGATGATGATGGAKPSHPIAGTPTPKKTV